MLGRLVKACLLEVYLKNILEYFFLRILLVRPLRIRIGLLVRSIENGHVLGSEGIILDEWNDGLIFMEPVPTGTLDVTLLLVEGETEAVLPGGFIRALPVSPAGVTPLHLP